MTTTSHKRTKTRAKASAPIASRGSSRSQTGRWTLRDAKAKFSEVIKRVHSDGPQRVSVRGEREVVIVAAEEYQRLKGYESGQVLIDALASSPLRDVDFDREPYRAPVRDIEL